MDLLVSHLGVEGKGSEVGSQIRRSVEVTRLKSLKEDVEVQTAAATALAELGLPRAQIGSCFAALHHHDHGQQINWYIGSKELHQRVMHGAVFVWRPPSK